MKEQIIQKARELFLTLGVKSVTMDDIANRMGISKKTIYVHFENKTKLVERVTFHVFNQISKGIDCICNKSNNPIEELYQIKDFVMVHLNDEKSSPHYQLQKYYPKIYASLIKKQFEVTHDCAKENLLRGISQGYFRENIDVEFISRLYFSCLSIVKNNEVFPEENFSVKMLMENYLEYHVRGICTPKGIKVLEKIINKNKD
ncbi:MAG: TetR/AcrR family transcriptional regulator [Flavobacteriaceae bacterium]|nr:TetR/AcrR family transcriptional regulator [Flavobacteriaceae bacterium]